ncbi:MAG: HAMP domain-containing sensor histidine kinase [Verrucomicrobiota bacterium]|jgi:signal transduction histidine kinase
MKKVALVFLVAVLAPSLVLAWLAVRSLRDQQFLLERQQSLLDQGVTDSVAQGIADYLARQQQDFSAQVESLGAGGDPNTLATHFDDELRQRWPLAEVGFCVTAAGKVLSPPPNGRAAAQMFRLDNSGFLGNREPVEVYLTANNSRNVGAGNTGLENGWSSSRSQVGQPSLTLNDAPASSAAQSAAQQRRVPGALDGIEPAAATDSLKASSPAAEKLAGAPRAGGPPEDAFGGRADPSLSGRNAFYIPSANQAPAGQGQPANARAKSDSQAPYQNALNYKAAQSRNVSPQSQVYQNAAKFKDETAANNAEDNLSKVIPAEAEFRQLIGDQSDGMLARFLQNKLKLMCWHRLSSDPDLIFGAQLNLDRVVNGLRGLVRNEGSRDNDLCLAVLDDNAKPVVMSQDKFQANWKRPFVATEVGDALPHWEIAAYLVNPAQLTRAAHVARLTLGLLIAVLVVAIGIGSLLIVRSLNAELKLARQKTDFVSNVSHELKTPLTSIRMFSELLAEGRVADPAKHRSYLHIITAETARLTRLINNVLDFSRMERGEKKYSFQACDLTEIVRAAADTFRPHLESAGFLLACELPPKGISIRADADAVSQVIVNLLSNAEKYSALPERRSSIRPGSTAAAARESDPTAAPRQNEISIELAEKQSPVPYAEVRVLDRGPGVPPGCEEKVFEKFYRAHDSLSSGIQGSGLGLTIARQIARAHGGDVVYEPREGGGSCFSLRLPVQKG